MKRLLLSLLLLTAFPLHARADNSEALRERVQRLSEELDKLKQELNEVNTRQEALADQQQTAASGAPAASPVSIWGYGEINYNRPTEDSSQTRMDLRRAVIGFGYAFDDATHLHSEFEFEHAVTSADDEGEVGVEQFYIDHALTGSASLKAGLFVIPMGFLNESHEPTRYYGVERNFVETAIIPTTWREGGVGVYGGGGSGLDWDVGVTTGFNLGKWDPASTEGQESPLGSIHQELQNASAKDLSLYLALNYRGVPGWVAGASVFGGEVSQGDPAARLASDARLTLWDVHTRWTHGNFDLAALYAMGHLSNTGDLNATFVGNPSLIPRNFWGGYVQGAYRVALGGSQSVAPFARYERFNTGAEYADLPAGLDVDSRQTETVWTTGVNYYLNPKLVFKADYQHFSEDDDRNRFDLGMGLEF